MAHALLRSRSLLLGLVAAVVLASASTLYFLGDAPDPMATASDGTPSPAAAGAARGLADTIVEALLPAREAAATLARDPAVVGAFTGDEASRSAVADSLLGRIPGARRVRLLPPGVQEPDLSSQPPLSFASLQLLREAERSTDPVPVELVLSGSPAEHLVLVERVLDASGVLLGLLHASLDSGVVRSAAAAWSPGGAHAELRQPAVGVPPLVIAATAGTKAPATGQPVTVPVPGSRWVVSLWPGAARVATASEGASGSGAPIPGWLLAAGTGAGVLLLAGGALLALRPRGTGAGVAAAASDVVFAGAVRSIIDGQHPGLERLIPGLPGVRGETTDVGAISAGLDGEDITRIASAARPALANVPRAETAPEPEAAPDPMLSTAAQESVMIDFGLLEATMSESPHEQEERVPASIFRNYDIRGVVGRDLTEDVAFAIGRAVGSEAEARGQRAVVVARDGRHSSPTLTEALVQGLVDAGCTVIDIGLAPSPVLYFATHFLDTRTGVMVTGSHNPPDWNGFKIVLDGEALAGEAITAIRTRINRNEYASGKGSREQVEITPEYIRRVSEDVPVAFGNALRIVVDAGNSVSGLVAPPLLRALGHDVVELNCEVDGDFPSHHPDPSQPENLVELVSRVIEEEADLGLAFDGDGDRLGVVDGEGRIIWPDEQLMLLARDVLSRNPGAPILFDVKCSRRLYELVARAGGKPVMTRTGHSLIKARMKELSAPLAGEFSGHIFFSERWYGFDDAFYAAARLLEILIASKGRPAEVFASLPAGVNTPELRIEMDEALQAAFMSQLVAQADFPEGKKTTIDGLRVDFAEGWGLVRPSTTMPALVMRFEGRDEAALADIQQRFATLIHAVRPELSLPF